MRVHYTRTKLGVGNMTRTMTVFETVPAILKLEVQPRCRTDKRTPNLSNGSRGVTFQREFFVFIDTRVSSIARREKRSICPGCLTPVVFRVSTRLRGRVVAVCLLTCVKYYTSR